MELFTFMADGGFPDLCAWLFLRRMQCVQRSSVTRYTIVVMEKGGLGLDVISSLKAEEGFTVYYANRTDLHSICRAFLPTEIGDYNYVTESDWFAESKQRYREFLSRMWEAMSRKLKVDMVLSANIVYFAERELSAMLKDKFIPHVVIHKECLKSPRIAELFLGDYRDKVGALSAHHVMVYNKTERKLQQDAGIIAPEHISITGMPRLDRFHAWRLRGNEIPKNIKSDVLVMFFHYNAGIANTKNSDVLLKRGWKDLCHLSYAAISRLAIDNPDITISVKSKGFKGGGNALARFMFGTADYPANIRFVMGEDPYEHITACKVVCGFNTTGLLEAVAAGIPIVVPRYAEAVLPETKGAVVALDGAADYADTPEELTLKLAHYAKADLPKNTQLNDGQKRDLDKWVGNADGLSGQRVRNTVLAVLCKKL